MHVLLCVVDNIIKGWEVLKYYIPILHASCAFFSEQSCISRTMITWFFMIQSVKKSGLGKERGMERRREGGKERETVSVFVFIEDVHSALNRKHEKHKTLSFQAASALV